MQVYRSGSMSVLNISVDLLAFIFNGSGVKYILKILWLHHRSLVQLRRLYQRRSTTNFSVISFQRLLKTELFLTTV